MDVITYDVESEVVCTAHLTGCVFSTAVIESVIIRTDAGQCERSLFVVDFVALLCQ